MNGIYCPPTVQVINFPQMTQIKTGKQEILQVRSPINLLNVVRLCFKIPGDNLLLTLTRISHQFACRHRIVVCCQHVMIICSLYRHNRLRLMRSLRPPWAQPCGRLAPCKSAILPICLACLFAASGHMLPQPELRLCFRSPYQVRGRLRHLLAAQICPEQIWTSEGCPQGVRHGRRTSKILRDHRINW